MRSGKYLKNDSISQSKKCTCMQYLKDGRTLKYFELSDPFYTVFQKRKIHDFCYGKMQLNLEFTRKCNTLLPYP